jgi:hypothetical protein
MNWYDSYTTERDIDEVTAKRIRNVHGSHDEEHANIRKTLLLVLALQNPSVLSKDVKEKALLNADKLAKINEKISAIIEEGRKAKEGLL